MEGLLKGLDGVLQRISTGIHVDGRKRYDRERCRTGSSGLVLRNRTCDALMLNTRSLVLQPIVVARGPGVRDWPWPRTSMMAGLVRAEIIDSG